VIILDYRAPIYGMPRPPQPKLLDTIQNSAIRFSIGTLAPAPRSVYVSKQASPTQPLPADSYS